MIKGTLLLLAWKVGLELESGHKLNLIPRLEEWNMKRTSIFSLVGLSAVALVSALQADVLNMEQATLDMQLLGQQMTDRVSTKLDQQMVAQVAFQYDFLLAQQEMEVTEQIAIASAVNSEPLVPVDSGELLAQNLSGEEDCVY